MKRLLVLLVVAALVAVGLSACSSSNDNFFYVGGSSNTISAKGGEGTAGYGGNGAYFSAYIYEANQINFVKSGSVNTKVDTTLADQLASAETLTFGDVVLDVKSNMTVSAIASNPTTTPAYYMYVGDHNLYHWDSSTGQSVVTGIYVHNGATLTLGFNFSWNYAGPNAGNTGLDTAYIVVANDIKNDGIITSLSLSVGANESGGAGTLVPDGTDNDKGYIDLESDGLFINNGKIDLAGKDLASGSTDTNGGWGGLFYGWGGNVVVSKGSVDTSGGSGKNGGNAGWAEWDSNYGTWNSGPMTAMGGTGKNGYGGSGDWVGIYAEDYPGPVYNTATINVSGGNGTAGGGNAGSLDFSTGQDQDYYAGGDMVNAGKIIGNGGNATDAGNGGNGADYIDFQAYGANVRNSGSIEIDGGNGKGTGSVGGQGGSLYAWTDYSYTPYYNTSLSNGNDIAAAGSVLFSGNISADGGSGETGGSAGDIEFYQDSYPAAGDVMLVGYGNINLQGGKGHTSGGSGGQVDVFTDLGNQAALGTIYNEVAMNTSGGEGVTTDGGSGGWVDMYASNFYDAWSNPTGASGPFQVYNAGNITTMGGKGVAFGGSAGSIFLFSSDNLKNTGHLNVTGEVASGSTGTGGSGSYVDIYAVGNIVNNGAIETSGAFGKASGGSADYVDMYAFYGMIDNTGNITGNGGNTSSTGTNGSGADSIYLYSSYDGGPFTTSNTGKLQAKIGTGGTGGSAGAVYIDGNLQ